VPVSPTVVIALAPFQFVEKNLAAAAIKAFPKNAAMARVKQARRRRIARCAGGFVFPHQGARLALFDLPTPRPAYIRTCLIRIDLPDGWSYIAEFLRPFTDVYLGRIDIALRILCVSALVDSIVAHFCSQATPCRLLQQNRHEAGGYRGPASRPLLKVLRTRFARGVFVSP
jgi:hypothetical protein